MTPRVQSLKQVLLTVVQLSILVVLVSPVYQWIVGVTLMSIVASGDVKATRRMLTYVPMININWQDGLGYGYLHDAAIFGRVDMLKLLLEQPNIDVNLKNYRYSTRKLDHTPLHTAALNTLRYDTTDFICHLVQDPRVSLNERTDDGSTALSHAAGGGKMRAVKCMIATGQPLDLSEDCSRTADSGRSPTNCLWNFADAIRSAEMYDHTDIQQLLTEYKANRDAVIAKVRYELGSG